MGSSANVNAFFGIMTTIIAVPTGVKVFDWLLTMYGGRFIFKPPMLFTIGFLVTFVIGGRSGVLLAMPPVDYLLHNTTFLIAHFHNMIIPGVLFGYLAGYMFWFPKTFGFKLNEKGARGRSGAGSSASISPSCHFGLMGMPRRMEHYDVAAWQPYLIIAAVGAFIIFLGIVCLGVQLAVSIRDCKQALDLTGDPWNGHSLEWATSSQPALYNFAMLPQVRSVDAFWDMKRRGVAYQRPDLYVDLVLPKNSFIAAFIGRAGFVFGFAMVWYMWWLAVLCLAAIALAVIVRASDDDSDYVMPASEVNEIEDARFAELAKAPRNEMADDPGFAGEPVLEASA